MEALLLQHFTLMTDQRSVSLLFNSSRHSKIKNAKIKRQRLEFTCFSYDIYRKGELNIPTDTLSRRLFVCLLCNSRNFKYCVFVIGRLSPTHVSSRGQMSALSCTQSKFTVFFRGSQESARSAPFVPGSKPKFFNRSESHLIKATQPWERLSVDFKGPVPSRTENVYILSIVDEFSRFPFTFPFEALMLKL